MSELQDAETDSGIQEDRGSDSVGSDSNSIGSDSHSSTSSLDINEEENVTGENGIEVVTGVENGNVTVSTSHTGSNKRLEDVITILSQKIMLHTIARAVMLPQMIQYNCISSKKLRAIFRWTTRLIPVILFIVILISMSGAMSQLKPSDHPPQFFDPDSNIQKMLDLEGNLTETSVVNCWDCSAWYNGGGGGTTGGGGGGDTGGGGGGDTGGGGGGDTGGGGKSILNHMCLCLL